MKKISVVIPVYNTEKYLPACLDSVLSCPEAEIEVICVDDASTDRCPEILEAAAGRDSRVRVIRLTENRRQGYARGLGLSEAAGEYVVFLDSDDELAPGALEALYGTAKRETLDGIFFDSQAVFETEELARRVLGYPAAHTGTYPDEAVSGETLFRQFIRQNDWHVYVQRQFWRREHLLTPGISFPEGIFHDDELFSVQAILTAERVRVVPERFLIRNIREGSITATKTPVQDTVSYFTVYCRMQDWLAERPAPAEAEVNAAHIYELALRYYRMMDEEERRTNYLAGTDLEKEYGFFIRECRSKTVWSESMKKTFEPLGGSRSVVIYGAGKIARTVFGRMAAAGIHTEKFMVTSMEKNPEILFGRPVIPAAEYEPREGETVVVAMAEKSARAVSEELSRRGILHYCCDGSTLKGPFSASEENNK